MTASRPRIYIGIDPGASGAIAAIAGDTLHRIPLEKKTLPDILQELFRFDHAIAVIERNTGYIGDGGNPGSAMFKFGRSAGALEMALVAAGIPYTEVGPAQWQKALGIPARRKKGKRVPGAPTTYKAGESKTEFKNRLRARAQQLFPSATITLDVADAVLIAEFCRRTS